MHLTELIPGSLYQCDAEISVCATLQSRGYARLTLIDLCGIAADKIPSSSDLTYIRWPIEDGPVPHRPTLVAIERLGANVIESGGTVITMCSMGLNRSGLMSALILTRVRSMRGREALAFVRSKNANALRNDEFVGYLEEER